MNVTVSAATPIPADVTINPVQVTRFVLRYNARSGCYTQQFLLKNTNARSGATVTRSLYAVVANLAAPHILANKTGTTAGGSPYVIMPGNLVPGERKTVPLEFTGQPDQNYMVRVLASPGPP